VPEQEASGTGFRVKDRGSLHGAVSPRLAGRPAGRCPGIFLKSGIEFSVEARAIGGLFTDPKDIGLGMTVRLLGWSQ
jgi:hypothetical protein